MSDREDNIDSGAEDKASTVEQEPMSVERLKQLLTEANRKAAQVEGERDRLKSEVYKQGDMLKDKARELKDMQTSRQRETRRFVEERDEQMQSLAHEYDEKLSVEMDRRRRQQEDYEQQLKEARKAVPTTTSGGSQPQPPVSPSSSSVQAPGSFPNFVPSQYGYPPGPRQGMGPRIQAPTPMYPYLSGMFGGGLPYQQPPHQQPPYQQPPYQPLGNGGRAGSAGKHDVPLPRQMTFDGKASWETFIQTFKTLAMKCGWDDQEKLFRLCNSLRGDAADFAYVDVPPEDQGSFLALEAALGQRFKERRSATSYLAELDNRKLGSKEKLSEYVAEIRKLVRKSYPTADEDTRETIALRHFIKGLPDQAMAVSIGMKEPKNIMEAQAAVETYSSLKEESSRGARVRSVQPSNSNQGYEAKLQDLEKKMQSKFEELKGLLENKSNPGPVARGSFAGRGSGARGRGRGRPFPGPSTGRPQYGSQQQNTGCYNCGEKGHFKRDCPKPRIQNPDDESRADGNRGGQPKKEGEN